MVYVVIARTVLVVSLEFTSLRNAALSLNIGRIFRTIAFQDEQSSNSDDIAVERTQSRGVTAGVFSHCIALGSDLETTEDIIGDCVQGCSVMAKFHYADFPETSPFGVGEVSGEVGVVEFSLK